MDSDRTARGLRERHHSAPHNAFYSSVPILFTLADISRATFSASVGVSQDYGLPPVVGAIPGASRTSFPERI